MVARRAVPAAALAAFVSAGCSGQPCGELPALLAKRDAARAAYLDLAQSATATPDETEEADAELHALDRRLDEIEQDCRGR